MDIKSRIGKGIAKANTLSKYQVKDLDFHLLPYTLELSLDSGIGRIVGGTHRACFRGGDESRPLGS